MQIKINEKTYDLYFGWDFLEQINNQLGFEMDVEGQAIKTKTGGMNFLEMGLSQYDPITVVKVIKAATNTLKAKPSTKDIQGHIEELIGGEVNDYTNFVDELHNSIKKDKLLNGLQKVNQKLNA